jgi:hypothetical protein
MSVATNNGLTLGSVFFPVKSAMFQTNGRELFLEVECGRSPGIDMEHGWWGREPRFYADSAPIPVDGDAEVAEIATDSGWRGEDALFALYMHEHEDVTRCRGYLCRVGHGYQLDLEGVAEVMGEPFPFTLTTVIVREPWPDAEPRFLR